MSKIKKVAVIPHVGKSETFGLTKKLVKWFLEHSITPMIPEPDAKVLGQLDFAQPEAQVTSGVDLVVALGGDGTVLRAAKLLDGKDTPILGVNLGKFGFLSEVEVSQLYDILPQALQGKSQLERRMMLKCELFRKQKKVLTHRALNEVVVNRSSKEKLLHMDIYINGVFFNRYSADGVIFATPTGSTAYSLSAGGPIVSPKEKLIIMTPVCSHSFFNRSLILNKSDEVRLGCPDAGESDVTVSLDGVVFYSEPFDFMKISASRQSINLTKANKRNFYTTLKDKLSTWTLGEWHEKRREESS